MRSHTSGDPCLDDPFVVSGIATCEEEEPFYTRLSTSILVVVGFTVVILGTLVLSLFLAT